MSEIKFRAWDRKAQLMVNEEALTALVEGKEIQGYSQLDLASKHEPTDLIEGTRYRGNPFKMNRLTLMQYTGLKDKNGVEIYQGDIVAPEGGYEDGECERPAQVYWSHDNLQWFVQCVKHLGDKIPLVEYDSYAVIGNIYENPELINASNN